MADFRIEIDPSPKPQDVTAVRDGLRRFNHPHLGEAATAAMGIFLRDPAGAVVGGLVGEMRLGWLHISMLWVSEGLRGQGFGTRLLAAAEEEARKNGCRHAYLDTLSFQARPFYERRGWQMFGALEDFPAGHTRYFMQKALA
jgi:GNAT superfamily N-acetyltransferase